ncbi:unnamed protein product, partial [Allacma fusca]
MKRSLSKRKSLLSKESLATFEGLKSTAGSGHGSKLSPLVFYQVTQNGGVEEFKRIVSSDIEKLDVCDNNGRTAIHYAALKNCIAILKIILEYKGNISILDIDGNSPLHLAVQEEALDAISFLLRHGANPGVLNKKYQSVLHLAAELGKVRSLKVEQLLASPRRACSHSMLPVHEAARRGSLKSLENLLCSAAKVGCLEDELLNVPDNEGNLALHLAVQSGNYDTVRICLRSGSKISALQKSLSNAVHIACAQGSIEIVKLMFKLQPNEREKSLASRDSEGMTPLHYAAMFDHTDLVEFLAEQ